MYNQRMKITVF